MRTRNSSKRQRLASVDDNGQTAPTTATGRDSLISGTPVKPRGDPSGDMIKRNVRRRGCAKDQEHMMEDDDTGKDTRGTVSSDNETISKGVQTSAENQEETHDSDWEDGLIQDSTINDYNDKKFEVTVEFTASPDSSIRKPIRKFTAVDKEVAELVHKVHLLCLIARGRLVDNACNDPLIQAALLSLTPRELQKVSSETKLSASSLAPLVTWFHKNFHVRSPTSAETPVHSALLRALETKEGAIEEMVALSVALFRSLNLTTRFVSILDVASLKPEADKPGTCSHSCNETKDLFASSTLMVPGTSQEKKCLEQPSTSEKCNSEISALEMSSQSSLNKNEVNGMLGRHLPKRSDLSADESGNLCQDVKGTRRKGDLEFEMQLQMALSATAVAIPTKNAVTDKNESELTTSCSLRSSTGMKRLRAEESLSSSLGLSTAIGSRKVGAPLYWAEVYCCGENMTGRWVHVDVIHDMIDGEQKVEAATSACKKPLRYVVAFAGNGAKDVTRRYCTKWYKISPKRVSGAWWDAVLAPLKQLESSATGGTVDLHQCKQNGSGNNEMDYTMRSGTADRSVLEDMELETRALTDPLPSNQQAYRNHSLYALEKWLTKYQILHPKGPVLGFCSGNPVYPRSCVQDLHTKERWLREALQIRVGELPVKVVKNTSKHRKGKVTEVDGDVSDESDALSSVPLYGKWQTEPLRLQPAEHGIVPKNERNQVDVWSEKCLPPGTVHLRFPRLGFVARRLEIDFAHAMVGFEFKNGKSYPVYEGIVVCSEFKEAILEAYAEERERKEEEDKRKRERLAISRWYQLLNSMLVRQRLENTYNDSSSSRQPIIGPPPNLDNRSSCSRADDLVGNSPPSRIEEQQYKLEETQVSDPAPAENHEHVFVVEDEHIEDGMLIQTKRCHCGFSVQVELL